jgi:hypothetical protein
MLMEAATRIERASRKARDDRSCAVRPSAGFYENYFTTFRTFGLVFVIRLS